MSNRCLLFPLVITRLKQLTSVPRILLLLVVASTSVVAQTPIARYSGVLEQEGLVLSIGITHFQDRACFLDSGPGGVPYEVYGEQPSGFVSFKHSITTSDDKGTTQLLWNRTDTYSLNHLSKEPIPRETAIFRVYDSQYMGKELLVVGVVGGRVELYRIDVSTGREQEGQLVALFPSFVRYRTPRLWSEDGEVYVLTETEILDDRWKARFLKLDNASGEFREILREAAPAALREEVGRERGPKQIPPYSEIVEHAIQKARALAEGEKLKE